MVSIYLGVAAITWSIFSIQHPKGPQYTPPISVTMQCVINLTWQFFTVFTMIWICITIKELTGWEWHFISNAMENAKGTIAFCPMLAILMVLLIPLCTLVMEGKATHPELDEDGNVKWNPSGKIALIAVQVVRWLGFILLYVGTICVMVGAYTMTPETANGRGSVPLVGQTPFAKEPVGVNDMDGVSYDN